MWQKTFQFLSNVTQFFRFPQIWTSNFPNVVRQHTEGVVGSIICILLEIYFSLQQWKNFENPLRTDKVITMSLVYYFFLVHSVVKNNVVFKHKNTLLMTYVSHSHTWTASSRFWGWQDAGVVVVLRLLRKVSWIWWRPTTWQSSLVQTWCGQKAKHLLCRSVMSTPVRCYWSPATTISLSNSRIFWRSLCQIAVFCRVNTQTSCLLVYCLLQLCICISQMCCLLAYCLLQSHYPYLCVKMFIVCYLYATLECFVIECAKVHNNSYCIKFLIKTNICIFTYLFMFMYYT